MICDADNLLAVSEALQKVEILTGDYQQTLSHAEKPALFYFDPPYKPLNKTSSFNSYAKDEFDDNEQIRLRDFCKTLNNLGHNWILSNSDVKGKDLEDNFFDDIYEDFNINRVFARRSINANAEKFNMGVSQKGQAFRSNLLLFKGKSKRISSTILNAKLSA